MEILDSLQVESEFKMIGLLHVDPKCEHNSVSQHLNPSSECFKCWWNMKELSHSQRMHQKWLWLVNKIELHANF